MSTRIECFWAERTNWFLREYRRLVLVHQGIEPCIDGGNHDASSKVGIIERTDISEDGDSHLWRGRAHDPRWPLVCQKPGCTFVFVPEDMAQINDHRLYRRPGSNQMFNLANAPVGAMWDAFWLEPKGPDGKCIMVMVPGESGTWWAIDLPPEGHHQPWERQGIPPRLTVTPSLRTSSYHGFLSEGYLIEVDD